MEKNKRAIRRNMPLVTAAFLLLAGAALLLFIGLPSQNQESGAAEPGASGSSGLRKVRIVLDEYPNASHAFLLAAEAAGYMREAGLSLEPVVAGPDRNSLAMLDEGKADLALASQPDVLLARGQGMAVVSIAAVVQRPLVYLMVPENSPIHKPAHLDGKTVVFSGSPVHEAMLETMLDNAGGERPKVTLVPAEGKYAERLAAGQADALIGPTILEGKQRLERSGLKLRLIEPMLYGVPGYYETVLAAKEKAVEEDRETFDAVWSALAQGFAFVCEDPERAARLLSDAHVIDENPSWSVSLESLVRLLPFMQPANAPFGSQDKAVWRETEKWLADRGLIGHSLFTDDAFVDLAGEQNG